MQDDLNKVLLVFRVYGQTGIPAGTILYGASDRFGLDGRHAPEALIADGCLTEQLGVHTLTAKGQARLEAIPIESGHRPKWLSPDWDRRHH